MLSVKTCCFEAEGYVRAGGRCNAAVPCCVSECVYLCIWRRTDSASLVLIVTCGVYNANRRKGADCSVIVVVCIKEDSCSATCDKRYFSSSRCREGC